MIRVSVTTASGQNQFKDFDSQEQADQWVALHKDSGAWGKSERWVDSEDLTMMGEDRSKAIASQQVGGPDDERTQYKFAAEYTIETKDVTAQVAQEELNETSLAYLSSTDWYVTRFAETGVAIPDDVKSQRAAARTAIQR